MMIAANGNVTNKTYLQTKEFNAEFCIMELPSREAAIRWVAKIAKACRCSQELRDLSLSLVPIHTTDKEQSMSTKAQRIAGWVLTGLFGLFIIGASGFPKFIDYPGKDEMMTKLKIPTSLLPTLGILEITVAFLFLIPRTALLGAILTTGYLGSALWTHLRVGDIMVLSNHHWRRDVGRTWAAAASDL
jgi:uncharacterized membrane protein YphA (DoxX/SURF4 family)